MSDASAGFMLIPFGAAVRAAMFVIDAIMGWKNQAGNEWSVQQILLTNAAGRAIILPFKAKPLKRR